eukprot:TRINITY_DN58519_c0_g1_i1.p1 TRINITY_DN58519_c0_g1~~TRINITY_DN58519_c0_g1_i1.p1  ORF type:complete len:1908 (+),score=468.52 TRINITY_DN58519_c0_g1_i1:3180-8903(+)
MAAAHQAIQQQQAQMAAAMMQQEREAQLQAHVAMETYLLNVANQLEAQHAAQMNELALGIVAAREDLDAQRASLTEAADMQEFLRYEGEREARMELEREREAVEELRRELADRRKEREQAEHLSIERQWRLLEEERKLQAEDRQAQDRSRTELQREREAILEERVKSAEAMLEARQLQADQDRAELREHSEKMSEEQAALASRLRQMEADRVEAAEREATAVEARAEKDAKESQEKQEEAERLARLEREARESWQAAAAAMAAAAEKASSLPTFAGEVAARSGGTAVADAILPGKPMQPAAKSSAPGQSSGSEKYDSDAASDSYEEDEFEQASVTGSKDMSALAAPSPAAKAGVGKTSSASVRHLLQDARSSFGGSVSLSSALDASSRRESKRRPSRGSSIPSEDVSGASPAQHGGRRLEFNDTASIASSIPESDTRGARGNASAKAKAARGKAQSISIEDSFAESFSGDASIPESEEDMAAPKAGRHDRSQKKSDSIDEGSIPEDGSRASPGKDSISEVGSGPSIHSEADAMADVHESFDQSRSMSDDVQEEGSLKSVASGSAGPGIQRQASVASIPGSIASEGSGSSAGGRRPTSLPSSIADGISDEASETAARAAGSEGSISEADPQEAMSEIGSEPKSALGSIADSGSFHASVVDSTSNPSPRNRQRGGGSASVSDDIDDIADDTSADLSRSQQRGHRSRSPSLAEDLADEAASVDSAAIEESFASQTHTKRRRASSVSDSLAESFEDDFESPSVDAAAAGNSKRGGAEKLARRKETSQSVVSGSLEEEMSQQEADSDSLPEDFDESRSSHPQERRSRAPAAIGESLDESFGDDFESASISASVQRSPAAAASSKARKTNLHSSSVGEDIPEEASSGSGSSRSVSDSDASAPRPQAKSKASAKTQPPQPASVGSGSEDMSEEFHSLTADEPHASRASTKNHTETRAKSNEVSIAESGSRHRPPRAAEQDQDDLDESGYTEDFEESRVSRLSKGRGTMNSYAEEDFEDFSDASLGSDQEEQGQSPSARSQQDAGDGSPQSSSSSRLKLKGLGDHRQSLGSQSGYSDASFVSDSDNEGSQQPMAAHAASVSLGSAHSRSRLRPGMLGTPKASVRLSLDDLGTQDAALDSSIPGAQPLSARSGAGSTDGAHGALLQSLRQEIEQVTQTLGGDAAAVKQLAKMRQLKEQRDEAHRLLELKRELVQQRMFLDRFDDEERQIKELTEKALQLSVDEEVQRAAASKDAVKDRDPAQLHVSAEEPQRRQPTTARSACELDTGSRGHGSHHAEATESRLPGLRTDDKTLAMDHEVPASEASMDSLEAEEEELRKLREAFAKKQSILQDLQKQRRKAQLKEERRALQQMLQETTEDIDRLQICPDSQAVQAASPDAPLTQELLADRLAEPMASDKSMLLPTVDTSDAPEALPRSSSEAHVGADGYVHGESRARSPVQSIGQLREEHTSPQPAPAAESQISQRANAGDAQLLAAAEEATEDDRRSTGSERALPERRTPSPVDEDRPKLDVSAAEPAPLESDAEGFSDSRQSWDEPSSDHPRDTASHGSARSRASSVRSVASGQARSEVAASAGQGSEASLEASGGQRHSPGHSCEDQRTAEREHGKADQSELLEAQGEQTSNMRQSFSMASVSEQRSPSQESIPDESMTEGQHSVSQGSLPDSAAEQHIRSPYSSEHDASMEEAPGMSPASSKGPLRASVASEARDDQARSSAAPSVPLADDEDGHSAYSSFPPSEVASEDLSAAGSEAPSRAESPGSPRGGRSASPASRASSQKEEGSLRSAEIEESVPPSPVASVPESSAAASDRQRAASKASGSSSVGGKRSEEPAEEREDGGHEAGADGPEQAGGVEEVTDWLMMNLLQEALPGGAAIHDEAVLAAVIQAIREGGAAPTG